MSLGNSAPQQYQGYLLSGSKSSGTPMVWSPVDIPLSYSPYGSPVTASDISSLPGRAGGSAFFSPTPAAAPAAPTMSNNPNLNTPTYAQFAQQFANRPSPVIYNGGSAPSGMDAGDAAILQGIYNPAPASGGAAAKSGGGFVAPSAYPQAFAMGGMPSLQSTPWYVRREASVPHNAGLFNSPVPGRTDKLPTDVPGGSYVIPADVVSGLGEGNTMAGSAVLDKMFNTGPFGMKVPHGGRSAGVPKPPRAFSSTSKIHAATGGAMEPERTPIIAAGGEYLVHPESVKRIGAGDIKKGHKILDHFVVHTRNKTANEMKRLPGPVK